MSGTNIFKKQNRTLCFSVKILIMLLYYCLMSISANCLSWFLPLTQYENRDQHDVVFEVSGHFWSKLGCFYCENWSLMIIGLSSRTMILIYMQIYQRLAQVTPAVSSFTSLWKYVFKFPQCVLCLCLVDGFS